MSNVTFSFKALGTVISILDKVFKSNIHTDGLENLPNSPTLYVVNHFTRSETLLLPYVLYRHSGEMVHSLADSSLFHGRLGTTLRNLGAISTREPFRNRKIIQELMMGSHNWVIFPEGLMVKNKAIYHRGRYALDNPEHKGPPHTGAAVLALKAEIIKRHYLQACKRNDIKGMQYYETRYNFGSRDDLCFKDISVVPVNISYYPVRPNQNFFISLARLFNSNLPKRVEEELSVEGGILLSKTDINIHFDQPINLSAYLDNTLPLANTFLPFISREKRSDLVLNVQRHRLTHRFMNNIYRNVTVNIDHIFSSLIRYSKKKHWKEEDLKAAIYIIARKASLFTDIRLHSSLGPRLLRLVSDHLHPPYESIKDLAIEQEVIAFRDGFIEIKDWNVMNTFQFHGIRLKNLPSVFANEVEPLTHLIALIRKISSNKHPLLQREISHILKQQDEKLFREEWQRSDSKQRSKYEYGRPRLLKQRKKKLGVVLCHGYLAAPQECRALADALHDIGCSVYLARLAGHGTSPENLNKVTLDDWVDSFDRAYGVLQSGCNKVVVGGFSAGGLMALLAAANKQNHIHGVFSINAALKLVDLRSKLAPGITAWNDLLDRWDIGFGKLESIGNDSENPDVNYNRNYLNGVKVLEQLSERCSQRLSHIVAPALIIQADRDPVVHPDSGRTIHELISSDSKALEMVPSNRHNIIQSEDTSVLERVQTFVSTVMESSHHSQEMF